MSVVTNVMLSGSCSDTARLAEQLNSWLGTDGTEFGNLLRVDAEAGGRKAMECAVFLAAFNWLPVHEFVQYYQKHLLTCSRIYLYGLDSFQLFLKRQDDRHWEEVPQQDDGRNWNYRTREHDIHPPTT